MQQKDLISTTITGLTAGFIAWGVLDYVHAPTFGVPLAALVVVVPVLWALGVRLGYFLSTWWSFFEQLGKFAAIGLTNFAVDAGTTNLLVAYSGSGRGALFAMFKAVAFCVAFLHSYFWNRFWVFESGQDGSVGQFIKFGGVAIATLVVNVSVASAIVNAVSPGDVSHEVWVNVAVIAASAASLSVSFVGFRRMVFVRRDDGLVATSRASG